MKMLLMLSALLCAIQNASAAFIDSGSFLTDTTSELDWLDVTASVNRSYNDVSGQFGIGGDFAGWRFATDNEFGTLVGSWLGSVSVGYEKVLIPRDAAAELVTILGNTYDSYFQNTFGVTFGEFRGSPPGLVVGGLRAWTFTGEPGYANDSEIEVNPTFAYVMVSTQSLPSDYSSWIVGSLLVRASIPEPSSIALLGLGLAGLCFSRYKANSNL